MTETNEKFMKNTFKFHKEKFQQHMKSVNEIQDYNTIYSDFLLEFGNGSDMEF